VAVSVSVDCRSQYEIAGVLIVSKRRDVLIATRAMIGAVLPGAELHGFVRVGTVPNRPGPGGDVYGHPGSLEVVATELSPLSYNVDHVIPIEISVPEDVSDPDLWIDDFLSLIGAAVRAERVGDRFGCIAEWIEVRELDIEDSKLAGMERTRWASFAIMVNYWTPDILN
jgi:hypothetical protein